MPKRTAGSADADVNFREIETFSIKDAADLVGVLQTIQSWCRIHGFQPPTLLISCTGREPEMASSVQLRLRPIANGKEAPEVLVW